MSDQTKPKSYRQLIIPTIAALCALTVLLALGGWQIQRHVWKEDLLHTLSKAISSEPSDYNTWRGRLIDQVQESFDYVKLEGHFLQDKAVYIYTVRNRDVGVWVLAPLQLLNGDVMIVNKGFVSERVYRSGAYKQAHDGLTYNITGLIRRSETDGMLTPQPNLQQRLWYAFNLPQINSFLGVKNLEERYYLQADNKSSDTLGLRGIDPNEFLRAIPNKHFYYALTWYGLALTLIGVFSLFIWGKVKELKT